MRRSMKRFVAVAVIVGLALGCLLVARSAISAAPVSSGTTLTVGARPAIVPATYVLTPDGYFDPHCVYQVDPNQVLVPHGSNMAIVTISAVAAAAAEATAMHTTTPQSRAHMPYTLTAKQIAAAPQVPPCTHPRYDLSGHLVAAGSLSVASTASSDPTVSGWVESVNSTARGPMSYLHAQWTVPPAPAKKRTQTVYFFPGLENTSGGTVIIMQPVLAWNEGGGGGKGWSGSSWNCCAIGNVYHGKYIKVTGSTVSGDIGGSGCNRSTGVCSSWSIVLYDWGSKKSAPFNTNAGGRAMDNVFGGALEVGTSQGHAPISRCSEFPGTSVQFSAFYLDNISGAHVSTPSWHHNPAAKGTKPSCSYGI